MKQITVYEKPVCTTCRKLAHLLMDKGIDFERVNYYIKPFTKNKLKTLIKKMSLRPSDLLRKKEPAYRELGNDLNSFSEDQILDLMIKNPDLIQRPIVELGNKAVLARPVEKVEELFRQ